MEEVWKTVVYQGKEFPRFEVSNCGQFRNVETGNILKQWINHKGYCQLCASLGDKGKKKTFKIHKAVAETFIPNPENKPIPNHKDGDKTNNHVSNLIWATNGENVKHAYDTGLNVPHKCEDHHNSKLTNEQVKYIRSIYIPNDREFGGRALAKKFGLHHSTIQSLLNKETYIDVA